jgi:hypothetical protein
MDQLIEIPEAYLYVANNGETREKMPGGVTGKGFAPGQSGNPSGRPKKKPISDLYEEILNDPEEMAKIRAAVVKSLTKGNMAMVLQLREMTDRVEGKVTQPIEHSGEVTLADRISKARAARAGSGS